MATGFAVIKTTKNTINRVLPQNSTARSVGVLASGTAIAQAIPIAISPILTRLYSPEEFGMVALYTACASILAVIATGRYELAITLPASDDEAASITLFTLKLCIVISVLLYFPIFFLGDYLAEVIGNRELKDWFYLLPLTVIATGAFNIFQLWCNRSSQYRQMSINRVQNSGFTALATVAMGLSQLKGGMIIGGVIGQTLASFLIGRSLGVKSKTVVASSRWSDQRATAKRYINHPKHIAPAQLIGVVAQQIPVFMISTLFALTAAGFFSLAYRLVSLPSGLIANAIGDVYRQKISVAYNERGEFRDIFVNTLKKTTIISLPPFVLLYFASPFIFEFVFGAPWRVAGDYAQILIVASFFQFVFTPIDRGAVVVGASKYIFAWHFSRFIGIAGVFGLSYLFLKPIESVLWLFVLVNVVLYSIEGVVGYKLSALQT